MTNSLDIKIEIPEVFKPVMGADPLVYPYISLPGGRASGKSYTVGIKAILKALQEPTNILFCREFQNSIRDSSYQVLVDTIHRLGVEKLFTINKTEITALNGSKISFKGLKTNVGSIKSFENIGLCVCEEAENISEESWTALIPTIRSEGSQIIVIFNPAAEEDPTYKRWVTNPLPGTLVVHSTYKDNPYLTDKTLSEIRTMEEQEPTKYANVYLGEPISDETLCIIRQVWFNACIDSHLKLGFKPKGHRVIGFDPADKGKDTSAVTARHGSVVNYIQEWSTEIEESTSSVYDYAIDNNIPNINFDAIGVGVGARVQFKRLDPQEVLNVNGFIGSKSATRELYKDNIPGNEYFKNLRAQETFKLADRFRDTWLAVTTGAYIDPDHMISLDSSSIPKDILSKLKYEATNIKEVSNSNFKQVESKKDMNMKSPNLFDSLVYAFAPIEDKAQEYTPINFSSPWE